MLIGTFEVALTLLLVLSSVYFSISFFGHGFSHMYFVLLLLFFVFFFYVGELFLFYMKEFRPSKYTFSNPHFSLVICLA